MFSYRDIEGIAYRDGAQKAAGSDVLGDAVHNLRISRWPNSGYKGLGYIDGQSQITGGTCVCGVILQVVENVPIKSSVEPKLENQEIVLVICTGVLHCAGKKI